MNEIFQELSNYQFELLQAFGGLGRIARGICAIASVLYIGTQVGNSLARAEPLDFMKLLLPVTFLLFIAFFPSFRLLIDGILSPISGATSAYQASAEQDYDALMASIKAEAQKQAGSEINPNTAGSESGFMESIEKIWLVVKTYASKMGIIYIVFGILYAILQAVLKGAIFIMLLMRAINMVILIIFGPVSFGISVFPHFRDSYKQWIANYINIYLWFPILNIVEAITFRANILAVSKTKTLFISLENDDVVNAVSKIDPSDFYGGIAIALGMSLAGIYAVFQVPQIANMVVQAATGGMAQAPTPGYHFTKSILSMPSRLLPAVGTAGSAILGGGKMALGGTIMAGRAVRDKFRGEGGKGNSRIS